jgi:hypothetical protein
MGAQIFPEIWETLCNILGVGRVAVSRFHTEGPQVTGVNVPNIVARATSALDCVALV